VLRADDLAVRTAADKRRRGAPLVADVFKGRAHAALPALIDGEAGAVWVAAGQVRAAFMFAEAVVFQRQLGAAKRPVC
jgi:hypothetical protein